MNSVFIHNLQFLHLWKKCARRLNGKYISQLAKAHYESRYNPPRKAFDFYTALALTRFMNSKEGLLALPRRRLFYSDEYGMTLVSQSDTWEATIKSYIGRIDIRVQESDNDFIKTKKDYFKRKISIMQTIAHLPQLKVCSCPF